MNRRACRQAGLPTVSASRPPSSALPATNTATRLPGGGQASLRLRGRQAR